MPSRDVHIVLGAVAGPVSALALQGRGQSKGAQTPSGPMMVGSLAGAVVGGVLGGRAPDQIDPPTSPRHRGFGHSLLFLVGLLLATLVVGLGVRDVLLAEAERLDKHRNEIEPMTLKWWALCALEIGLCFLAYLPVGFLGGSISHLGADMTTPAGINILGRGR